VVGGGGGGESRQAGSGLPHRVGALVYKPSRADALTSTLCTIGTQLAFAQHKIKMFNLFCKLPRHPHSASTNKFGKNHELWIEMLAAVSIRLLFQCFCSLMQPKSHDSESQIHGG
jgi:hypothetical protein